MIRLLIILLLTLTSSLCHSKHYESKYYEFCKTPEKENTWNCELIYPFKGEIAETNLNKYEGFTESQKNQLKKIRKISIDIFPQDNCYFKDSNVCRKFNKSSYIIIKRRLDFELLDEIQKMESSIYPSLKIEGCSYTEDFGLSKSYLQDRINYSQKINYKKNACWKGGSVNKCKVEFTADFGLKMINIPPNFSTLNDFGSYLFQFEFYREYASTPKCFNINMGTFVIKELKNFVNNIQSALNESFNTKLFGSINSSLQKSILSSDISIVANNYLYGNLPTYIGGEIDDYLPGQVRFYNDFNFTKLDKTTLIEGTVAECPVAEANGEWAKYCIESQLNLLSVFNQFSKEDKLYLIKKGDTLWKIALNEYGLGEYWLTLAGWNSLHSYQNLRVGQQIEIPTLVTLSSRSNLVVKKGDTLNSLGLKELPIGTTNKNLIYPFQYIRNNHPI